MLDKKLKREKEKYEDIKAPDNMEEKLSSVLFDKRPNKNKFIFPKVASFLIIIGFLVASNSNSIGIYIRDNSMDKKIIKEYSQVMPESLKNLGNEGQIQNISKKIVLDGREIVVDGMIVDELGVNLFIDAEKDAYIRVSLIDGKKKGEYSEVQSSGLGLYNNDKSREKWKYYFEEKIEKDIITLDFINEDNKSETLEIKIDDELRIKYLEKINIDKKIKVGKNNYYIKKLYISPIGISLDGYNENIIELGISTILNNRKRYDDVDMDLIINGERVNYSRANRRADLSGVSFGYSYDNFPRDIESLSIEVVERKDGEIVKIIENIKVK